MPYARSANPTNPMGPLASDVPLVLRLVVIVRLCFQLVMVCCAMRATWVDGRGHVVCGGSVSRRFGFALAHTGRGVTSPAPNERLVGCRWPGPAGRRGPAVMEDRGPQERTGL